MINIFNIFFRKYLSDACDKWQQIKKTIRRIKQINEIYNISPIFLYAKFVIKLSEGLHSRIKDAILVSNLSCNRLESSQQRYIGITIKNKKLGVLLFIARRKLIIAIPINFKYQNFSANVLSLLGAKFSKFLPGKPSIRVNKINIISMTKIVSKKNCIA